ncbi:class I SAM-dependent methyltransferase [Providencia rettgeri]|uniref:class I SAM-dependent methyltransferase n=1 Tax=Providencia rettgeri TaxID=587 RepID=UPI0034E06628
MHTNHFSPSRTAITMALARAVHQLLDEPIVLQDPIAEFLLDEDMRLKLHDNPYEFNDPMARTMRAAMVARNCVVRDALIKAKKENHNLKQFVMLGCGLDAFSLNQASIFKDIQFYDVDTPKMMAWRADRLNEHHISLPENVHNVNCDFNHQNAFEALSAVGFNKNEPVIISFMGVTPYLSNEVIYNMMEQVLKLPKGSSIHFDYRVQSHLLNPIEQMMDKMVAAQVAKFGEPWLSEFIPDDLRINLLEMGFSQVEHFDTTTLNERYFARRKDGLQTTGGGLRLISAFIE